ncbi:MAG TPA: TIGR04190 family B12-binding domain/radical SAM domain protein [Anaerolineaceae bacterium]|nr:MAG: B12-binding domain/radical SAM domain protein [Chloroflexi bacterium GWB2_54_36]HAL17955.1 TIGR04190 family B12-binding domain/radical SAM domain protein [Anaerolineaceae bacterium]
MAIPDLTLLHAPSVYDFRRESILYGPVSDLVPSTPVFEMYPIGFTTMAEYLERHDLQTRIVNLAVRMLDDINFDVEDYIQKLDSLVYGIDLHWLPHAHGSVEISKIVKRYHPKSPVLFGGFSSSYFYKELISYPSVDFIIRGDSTELPLLMLMQYLRAGGEIRPEPLSLGAGRLEAIPNLVYKTGDGEMHANPISYSPDNLDDLLLDYTHVLRSVVRYRDLASYKPFRNWMKYPITAALTVRGCRYNCTTCGGSACAFRGISNRQRPAYRSPELLAQDIRRIGEYSKGPVFILGDIRQPGEDYTRRFLDAISGYKKPVFIELFDAAPKKFFQDVARAMPNFTVEISMESHDEPVRKAFGRPYSTADIERSMDDALDAGCKRLDLFFMVGLKGQTYESVMGTVEYSRQMLKRYDRGGEHRVIPFISPLAPFVDPGSRAFEEPEKHGYRLFARTLEEHRRQLLAPSWKYVLNYETIWMNRDQIANATYESGRQLNLMKGEFGVLKAAQVLATDQRIKRAVELMGEIDRIVQTVTDPEQRQVHLNELKHHVDDANLSTVCDKRELEIPMHGPTINLIQAAASVVGDWWHDRAKIFRDN